MVFDIKEWSKGLSEIPSEWTLKHKGKLGETYSDLELIIETERPLTMIMVDTMGRQSIANDPGAMYNLLRKYDNSWGFEEVWSEVYIHFFTYAIYFNSDTRIFSTCYFPKGEINVNTSI